MGHDVRIKFVFGYECPLLEPRILTNPHMIQTGHIWFFQLAVCFWVLGLPLFIIAFFRCNNRIFHPTKKGLFMLANIGRRSILKFAEYHGLEVQVGCCEEKSDFLRRNKWECIELKKTPKN